MRKVIPGDAGGDATGVPRMDHVKMVPRGGKGRTQKKPSKINREATDIARLV